MTSFDGKSVARADLASDISSSEPASPGANDYIGKLSATYGLSVDSPASAEPSSRQIGAADGEDEVEFRLFAKKASHNGGATTVQKIRLRSPSPASHELGFVQNRRPRSYYFTDGPTDTQIRQFQQAAVSGADITAGLEVKWKGCELPWRVTVIGQASTKNSLDNQRSSVPAGLERQTKKGGRKGKKKRIAIRKKIAAGEAQKVSREEEKMRMEAGEKEKRNRRNREKKQKKRRKQRDAKRSSMDSG